MKEFEKKVFAEIENKKRAARSVWEKGVLDYAIELFKDLVEACDYSGVSCYDFVKDADSRKFDDALRNGAENWSAFSWGASSLIYNEDIAKRLCTPSELRRTKCGMKQPNSREDWLDCQARALAQAAPRLYWIAKGAL